METQMLYGELHPTKLFVKVAVPSIISMLMSSLYVIIDGVCVGQFLGSQALAAVNLVMPLVFINFSIADLIGVGSSVQIAIKLGEGDTETANNLFSSACVMILAAAVILGGVFFCFADDFVRLMGASEALVQMSTEYFRVYALFAPLITIVFAMDNYLRICGKVHYSMLVNILMSVLTVIFEVIFLSVLKLGIWSAGLAACLGMAICTGICLVPFLRRRTQLRFTHPRCSLDQLKTIFANGSPTFLNNISGRVTAILLNVYLLQLGGSTAVAAYSVLMYAEGIIFPLLYGLCDSLQPAIGYNYGARQYGRVRAIVRRVYGVCGVLSVGMTAVLWLGGQDLVELFVQAGDSALTVMSIHAMNLFAFTFLTRWISLASQSYLSAIGNYRYATLISTAMAFFFPMVFLIGLTSHLGLEALWLNMPLSALGTAALAGVLVAQQHRVAVANGE